MLVPRLKKRYIETIVPALKKKFGWSSSMQVPRLKAIYINQGVANAKVNAKLLDLALEELTMIAGQKAVPTKAKKAISNFKLREGMKIGARATLRGNRMYEFMERLFQLALPRARDFRGVKEKAFDGKGNYTLGIKEQIIFPEIDIDKVNKITGMNITFVTDTQSDEMAYELLKEFGMPFKNLHKKS